LQIGAKVVSASLSEKGNVESIMLDSGQTINADFYFETNASTVLVDLLEIEFESWRDTFTSNKSLSVFRQNDEPTKVHDTFNLNKAGWRQDLSVQGFSYNKLSFDDSKITDQQANQILMIHTEFWRGNCALIGDAAGYAESVHFSVFDLTQSALTRWLEVYPDTECNPLLAQEYNLNGQELNE